MNYRTAKVVIVGLLALCFSSCTGMRKQISAADLPHESFLFIIKRVTFSICQSDVMPETKPEEDSCAPVGQASISGSGFVVATDGTDAWGITAGHVCADDPIKLQSPNGTLLEPKVSSMLRVMVLGGLAYNAEVVNIYPSLDMCVLKIKGMVPRKVVKMSERPPIRGERHYVMAAPLGTFGPDLLPTFEGFYNGQTMNYPPPMGGEHIPYGVYTIPTKGGSSGSPILNSQGRLVGVTSGTLVGFENIAFSPPYEGVREVYSAVIKASETEDTTPELRPIDTADGGQ